MLLRVEDGHAATFFLGERFPVSLAQFSSSLGSSAGTSIIGSAGSLSAADLGISFLPTGNGPDYVATADLNADGFQDVIAVETGRPAAAIILTDALYGGLAGAAIGTGVELINGNDYGRDIAIGAGIGIVAGGIIGAVSVAGTSYHDTTYGMSEGTPVMGGAARYGAHF